MVAVRSVSGSVVGWSLTLSLALSLASSGCVKGVGEACSLNADCEAGLSCYAGKCVTCDANGTRTACVAFDLVTKTCDGAFEPLSGVDTLEFTLQGDGLTDSVQTAKLSDGAVDLPDIPEGTNRRLLVTAKQGDTVVSRGASGRFDVSFQDQGASATVYLRKVGEFSPANEAAAPGTCTTLNEARAGHTMTRLADGRVLVAGGYKMEGNNRVPMKSIELYDPRTGVFTSDSHTTLYQARWDHTATLLPDGRVLLVGGVGLINDKDNNLGTAELFDPTKFGRSDAVKPFQLASHRGRRRHTAELLPEEGVVVISGGYHNYGDAKPQDAVEVFDPKTNPPATFVPRDSTDQDIKLAKNRANHRMVAIGNGQVLVIGGTDGTAPIGDTDVIQVLNGQWSIRAAVTDFRLKKAREFPLAELLGTGEGRGVLVLGKPADGSQTTADLWEWIKVGTNAEPTRKATNPPIYRIDACAAAFDAGTFTGIVTVGGRDTGAQRTLLSSGDALTLAGDPAQIESTRPGQINSARARVGCVTLADGSVLVAGGEALVANAPSVVDRVEIYQP